MLCIHCLLLNPQNSSHLCVLYTHTAEIIKRKTGENILAQERPTGGKKRQEKGAQLP